MRLRSGKMTSPRPHEETSSAGDTTTPQTVDTGSSMALIVSTVFIGPILTSCQPQTPTPTTMGTIGKHMPSYTAPMHRTLGMPTEFMANMHNLGSTYSDTSSSPFPRYQGCGPLPTLFSRPSETTDGLIEVSKATSLAESFEVMMVKTTKGFGNKDKRRPKLAYPQPGESLSDFQEKCKGNGSKALLCPKCSAVFDEKTVERLEAVNKAVKEEKHVIP
ncbi:hypothetical protein KIW84_044762 [Lathyrus oleraceus]|uniref:Uncharacterized protein n=1 Tax=Pisum sativum TaxID=3888 RepID=A0A9D4XJ02_PEA|nr:hypothetical protein KIW84_044762 [Pisum sativum]